MLSIAAGIAESNGMRKLLIGNHFGDHAIYPDCRKDFIESMSEAIRKGTYEGIEIFAPYTELDKRQIAQIGRRLGIDYATTWTCYKGGEVHCGVCGSCIERKEALEGFDNTVYLL
jgi:7-cyano-7-deazaguanine synthase